MIEHAPQTDPLVARPALTPGDLAGLLASFNDVTAKLQRSHERLHTEVARLTRELEEANRQIERSRRLAALGEMAAGIAHEVRNPLGSIRLYARMLEDDLRDRPDEQGVAQKIARAASALDGVVGDVLRFAREFRLAPEPVSPDEVLDRSLEACCPSGPDAPAGLVVERPAAPEGIMFDADAGLVQQALVNVIRNAMEAMAEASGADHRLALWAECRPTGHVALCVRDSGPGVCDEVIARMFNPFFTTRRTGTGLGLAIVHRIMDAHAGSVTVRNNNDVPGARRDERGARVDLVFPQRSAWGGRPAVVETRPASELSRCAQC